MARKSCKPWGVQRKGKNAAGNYSNRPDATVKQELKTVLIKRTMELKRKSVAAKHDVREAASSNSDATERIGPEFALEDAVADALRRIRATTQNLPIMARVVDQKHYVYCRGCEKHRGAGYFSYDSDQCAIFEYSSKPQCEWPHWLIDHRR